MEKNKEHQLTQRCFKEAHPDFAERIISAALRLPQQQPLTVGTWLTKLCVEYHLPRPAWVFSVVLVAGIVAGVIAPINNDASTTSQDTVYMQEFLYDDEAML